MCCSPTVRISRGGAVDFVVNPRAATRSGDYDRVVSTGPPTVYFINFYHILQYVYDQ